MYVSCFFPASLCGDLKYLPAKSRTAAGIFISKSLKVQVLYEFLTLNVDFVWKELMNLHTGLITQKRDIPSSKWKRFPIPPFAKQGVEAVPEHGMILVAM